MPKNEKKYLIYKSMKHLDRFNEDTKPSYWERRETEARPRVTKSHEDEVVVSIDGTGSVHDNTIKVIKKALLNVQGKRKLLVNGKETPIR
jgi:hypothetical protein